MTDPSSASASSPPSTYVVRPARAGDLRHLQDIEASGGQQFVDFLGPGLNPVLLATPATGTARADVPGFLLVAARQGSVAPWEQGPRGEPVGFAHVLDLDGHAHLEQLSVRPKVQRHGLGTRLINEAMAEARAQGYDVLSLCTYRDVPWNGPFYARLGFSDVSDLADFQQQLRVHEQQIGLDVDGVRVVMQVPLRRQVTRG